MASTVLWKKSKELLGGQTYLYSDKPSYSEIQVRTYTQVLKQGYTLFTTMALVWVRLFFTIKAHSPKGNTKTDYFFRTSQAQADEAIGYREELFDVRPARSKVFLLLEGHVLRNIHVFHLLVSCMHLAQEINKCLHASLTEDRTLSSGQRTTSES